MLRVLLMLVFVLVGCTVGGEGYVVHESRTERFNIEPNESLEYEVPADAVSWRLGGNPMRSSSPFVETMWYWLADGDNLDFFNGGELGAARLEPVPVGNARMLHVDNAGGQLVAGAVIWNLEIERK